MSHVCWGRGQGGWVFGECAGRIGSDRVESGSGWWARQSIGKKLNDKVCIGIEVGVGIK